MKVLIFILNAKGQRHKLRLTVFPVGKGTENNSGFMSVWLHRISNYFVQTDKLPEAVKIQVEIQLINQCTPTGNDHTTLTTDAVVYQNQKRYFLK